MKKRICWILCLVFVLSLSLAAVSCNGKGNDEEAVDDGYTKTIVYLGDSICESLLGASPLSERDSYGYYAVVGRRNNYRYIDCSVSGDTTYNMHKRLINTDTVSLERQYKISRADIIHISILGNDILGGNMGKMACDALAGDYTILNGKLTRAKGYIDLCIKKIKELNPDALIMINTVYNPLDINSILLPEEQKQAILELCNGDESGIRTVGADLLTRSNNLFYEYLDENPGAFEIIDIYTAFDNLYKEDYDRGINLIYGDWLHPSIEGHGIMADLIQAKLEALGLADNGLAISRYKMLRSGQLDKLYTGTAVDIASAKAAIDAAVTCEKITEVYFAAIRGVTPIYVSGGDNMARLIRHSGDIFPETRTYNVSSVMLEDKDYKGFLNLEKSCFTFNSDGTFSLSVVPTGVTIGMVNLLLYNSLKDGMDLTEDLSVGNFATALDVYVKNIWPGFDFRYLRNDINLLTSCGIYLGGIDYESENIKSLMTSLEQNTTIPAGFFFPSTISLELKGYYFVETFGNFTDIFMCVGDVSTDGYPFLHCTLHTEADGSTWVESTIEVSKVTITAGKK